MPNPKPIGPNQKELGPNAELVLRYYLMGLTVREIHDLVGLTTQRVYQILEALEQRGLIPRR